MRKSAELVFECKNIGFSIKLILSGERFKIHFITFFRTYNELINTPTSKTRTTAKIQVEQPQKPIMRKVNFRDDDIVGVKKDDQTLCKR